MAAETANNGAQLVLTELSDKVYDQLTHTEMIELIGIDRVCCAEPDVVAATRRAVCDTQKQINALDPKAGANS